MRFSIIFSTCLPIIFCQAADVGPTAPAMIIVWGKLDVPNACASIESRDDFDRNCVAACLADETCILTYREDESDVCQMCRREDVKSATQQDSSYWNKVAFKVERSTLATCPIDSANAPTVNGEPALGPALVTSDIAKIYNITYSSGKWIFNYEDLQCAKPWDLFPSLTTEEDLCPDGNNDAEGSTCITH